MQMAEWIAAIELACRKGTRQGSTVLPNLPYSWSKPDISRLTSRHPRNWPRQAKGPINFEVLWQKQRGRKFPIVRNVTTSICIHNPPRFKRLWAVQGVGK